MYVCHFEFMVQGDLHEYLIVHFSHSDISLVDKSRIGGRKVLEYPDMLLISTQVRHFYPFACSLRHFHI